MNRTCVSSSSLVSVGYNLTTQLLEVEFNGGSLYEYHNVPMYVYNGLMQAGSHGKYFTAYIKDKYLTRKIS